MHTSFPSLAILSGSARVLQMSLVLVILFGCGSEDIGSAGQVPSTSGPQAAYTDQADRKWREVIEPAPPRAKLDHESNLMQLVRQTEKTNQRRRWLGLHFWHDFENDSRRYDWLVLTTCLAPDYPVNIDDWALKESDIGINTAQIDIRQLDDWQAIYPKLRSTFWASKDVGERDRRLLWFCELRQRIEDHRRAVARGESIDDSVLVDDVLRFTETFGRPLSELDQEYFERYIGVLVSDIVHSADSLGMDQRVRVSFHESITAGALSRVERWNFDNVWPDFLRGGPADGSQAVSETTTRWRAIPGSGSRIEGRSVPVLWFAPDTYIGRVVYYHDQELIARKYRELGIRLWRESPDHAEMYWWLRSTTSEFPMYLSSIVDGAHTLAENSDSPVEVDLHRQALWVEDYAELRSEMMNHHLTTSEQKLQLIKLETESAMRSIQMGLAWQPDVSAVLEGVDRLWREFGDDASAERLIRRLVRTPDKFGLDNISIQDFLLPLAESKSARLNSFARSWFAAQKLRNQPLEFKGLTMDGQPFDLADMRGKIVLMDFWTTTCASCIAAMPRIHNIYREFHRHGFEVVSVSFDSETNRSRVKRLKKELGLTWTTLAAESQWEDFVSKYGLTLPEYMLLNRDGTLYAATSEVDMGRNLEALLNEMLAAEAAQKKAATVH